MASAKKGKKNKGKTLALSDFLSETPGAVSTMPIRKSTVNWADEVEDNHDVYDSRSAKASVILPTAPKASRDFDDIIDKVPQEPPFMAYLTNLPYDVDESEISYFFKNMKIANMRIPKDERPGETPRLKGFGYVEFEDRDSLLNALVIPDTTIKNRRIRIEVATDYDNDRMRRGGGRNDMSRDRGGPRGEGASGGDWRSGPRQESAPPESQERRGFRDRERDRDRDDSQWRSNREAGGGGGGFRDRFREDRGEERSFRRYEGRNGGGGGGGFTRRDPEERREEPRQRPKLMLTPRTKPVEPEVEKPAASAAIFGDAKPVDTSARERQIEERLLSKEAEAPPKRDISKERWDGGRERGEVDRDRREGDRERRDFERGRREDRDGEGERREEKKSVERERAPNVRSDVNGVVDKTNQQQSKRNNGEQEQKEPPKSETAEKQKAEPRKREEKKEKVDKEMPKLKKAEPPNFIASNKFAFLQDENSD